MIKVHKTVAKPFVKWAGGKGQLLEKLNTLYPKELTDGKISIYIEPFVGGGAVLFNVLQGYDVEKAVIIDLNKELINCYKCIKTNASKTIELLEKLQNTFLKLSVEQRKDYYIEVRKKYNAIKLNGHFDFEKAADFIFLNKTCFNGLYRVNSKGEFNVPFGNYKNPKICDTDNLCLVGELLQRVEIIHGDYSQCKKFANNKAFIYFDPPYKPITETQSFTGYQQSGFDDNNQIELAQLIKELSGEGAKILLSNSDPKNTNPNDDFFEVLYSDFDIKRVQAKRLINCQSNKRGEVTEIVVSNCQIKGA